VTGATVGTIAGFTSTAFLIAEIAAIVAMLTLDRVATPIIDCWDRGATGEEHVGRILDGLAAQGWRTVHDIDTGRGNIDHVAVGGPAETERRDHNPRVRLRRFRYVRVAIAPRPDRPSAARDES